MKKAFTLIELLVVIAIIAILAALLMPALTKAKAEAQKAACKANVHNAGLAFEMFLNDSDGVYPGWVVDENNSVGMNNDPTPGTGDWASMKGATATGGTPLYQLYDRGYMRDSDVFDCPSADNQSRGNWGAAMVIGPDDDPDGFSGIARADDPEWFSIDKTEKIIYFAEYGYDHSRIARQSVPARVMYGDMWERGHGWGYDVAYWPYNHPGGSNVLFVDNAVEFAPLLDTDDSWYVRVGWSNWWRNGWIANPRMDEDAHRWDEYDALGASGIGNGPQDLKYPRDKDDVYAIEGWNVNSPPQVEAGNRWSYQADPLEKYDGMSDADGWSYNSGDKTLDPDGTSPVGGGRTYRFWSFRPANRRFFPEVGDFAKSGDWDTHDARLMSTEYLTGDTGF